MSAQCGGCQGIGAHRRWCRAVVGPAAALLGPLAEQAEALGDRVGPNDMGAANHLYAASALLRARAVERWAAHEERMEEERG